MNPFMNSWLGFFRGPWSGDVKQDINPVTSWLSPQVEFNFAGDQQIEAKVVSDVASYGKQLGLLTEALLELAEKKQGPALDRLSALSREIEAVKTQHRSQLENRLRSDLEQLKQQDPAALEQLIREYG